MKYRLYGTNPLSSGTVVQSGNVSFFLDGENRFCAAFLADWKAGAEVVGEDDQPIPYPGDGALP